MLTCTSISVAFILLSGSLALAWLSVFAPIHQPVADTVSALTGDLLRNSNPGSSASARHRNAFFIRPSNSFDPYSEPAYEVSPVISRMGARSLSIARTVNQKQVIAAGRSCAVGARVYTKSRCNPPMYLRR